MLNPFNRLNLDPRVKKAMPFIVLAVVVFLFMVVGYSVIKIKDIANNPGANVSIYDQGSGGLILDVFIRVLLVFGLMYLFFAILKWWQTKKPATLRKGLSVVETVRLSPRQSLHVVRYHGQEFLIGATDQSMSLISEIDNGLINDEEDEIPAGEENVVLESEGFKGLLLKNIGQSLNIHRKSEKTSPS